MGKYIKKTNNPNMGRTKADIDWKKVEALCQIQCTESEIASVIGVHLDTITSRCQSDHGMTFPEFFKKHSENGKASLRRRQFAKAMEGHPTMLVWLGKQMLGQKDVIETRNVEPIKLGYDPVKLLEEDKE